MVGLQDLTLLGCYDAIVQCSVVACVLTFLMMPWWLALVITLHSRARAMPA